MTYGPSDSGNYKEEALCENCMDGFMANVCVIHLSEALRSRYCEKCVTKELQAIEARTPHTSRETLWKKVCPPAYQQTIPERLRDESKLRPIDPKKMSSLEFVSAFLERPFSQRGVGLVGKTRLGKTRLMFALLKEYFLKGKSVAYTFAPDFSDEYSARMADSPAKGNAYLEWISNAETWFLDDLGKGRLSESCQRALLRVIEKRTNQLRPIFVTSNSGGDDLIKLMRYEDGQESEYASPMIERLREFCDFYIF